MNKFFFLSGLRAVFPVRSLLSWFRGSSVLCLGVLGQTILAQNVLAPALEQVRAAEAVITRGNTAEAQRLLENVCRNPVPTGLLAARCFHDYGTIQQLEGHFDRAAENYKRATQLWESAGGPRNAGLASTLQNLSEVLRELGSYPEAESAAQSALVINQTLNGQSAPRSILAAGQLGRVLLDEGRMHDAAEWVDLADRLNSRTPVPMPEGAALLRNVASLRTNQGRLVEAATIMRRALEELAKTTSGGGEYASTLRDLAVILRRLGRPQEASPLLRRAALICEQSGGPGNPMLVWIWREQALVALSEHHPGAAEELIRRALEATVSAPENRNVHDVLIFQSDLGQTLAEQGRYSEAEALLLEVEKRAGQNSLNASATASNQARLGRLYEMQKDYQRSENNCRAAVRSYEAIGTADMEFASILRDCARVVKIHDRHEARAMDQRSQAIAKRKSSNRPQTALVTTKIGVAETGPILAAFNSLDSAIADCFDRDPNSARFPQTSRQLVFQDLSEIKSGMLAIIHDVQGAHEGNQADIPKVIPSLHAILTIMGGEALVVKDVALYEERVSVILPTVDVHNLH